ncbi:ABC transporter related [Ignisphaera aggregans DSM 17230]|uniref:ABC transporter related n=1 Tax=Ignisphaera aggregans (strain DSM 17230 / JCM 13409 / AQ1.S1) TaxID=583356 RepID=E0SNH2_IGNAA|nr:ABC transporter related [Ignisphaera aggregans DSM 17230]
MSIAVDVRDLVKIYPNGVRGVDGATFSVYDGEIFGLIGPNGSGKTTTLRILATILKPSSGYANIYGFDVVREPERVRRIIGYLPEDAGAYRDMTGLEYITFILGLRFRGKELEEDVEEAVKISRLGRDVYRPIRSYSKGMKRILNLAITLAQRPKLYILDEPTSGLDVEKSIEVRNTIASYSKSYGATILLSSHNMLEVEYLCNRVAIIYRGKIVSEGYIDEIKSRYSAKNLEEAFIYSIKESKTSNT